MGCSVSPKKAKKVTKVTLEFVRNVSTEAGVELHPDLVQHMKPHQAEGIKFLYDTVIESVEKARTEHGSGAILAHCTGSLIF